MAIILADTNAILYFLKGYEVMEPYKQERFGISDITEIELLGVKGLQERDFRIRSEVVSKCILYPFTSEIKAAAILLKQNIKLKIPDAIIAATALHFNLTLLSADKEFVKIKGLPLILLEL